MSKIEKEYLRFCVDCRMNRPYTCGKKFKPCISIIFYTWYLSIWQNRSKNEEKFVEISKEDRKRSDLVSKLLTLKHKILQHLIHDKSFTVLRFFHSFSHYITKRLIGQGRRRKKNGRHLDKTNPNKTGW